MPRQILLAVGMGLGLFAALPLVGAANAQSTEKKPAAEAIKPLPEASPSHGPRGEHAVKSKRRQAADAAAAEEARLKKAKELEEAAGAAVKTD